MAAMTHNYTVEFNIKQCKDRLPDQSPYYVSIYGSSQEDAIKRPDAVPGSLFVLHRQTRGADMPISTGSVASTLSRELKDKYILEVSGR